MQHNPSLIVTLEPRMTLREIGEVLGCSPEYVRNIEKSAFAKLRQYCAERGLALTDYLDP